MMFFIVMDHRFSLGSVWNYTNTLGVNRVFAKARGNLFYYLIAL